MESPIKRARLDDVNTATAGTHHPTTSIYLDYNATAPLADSVADIIRETLSSAWQNPSSSYEGGVNAKQIITVSRKHISAMLNGCKGDIVFMSGGTEANNNIIHNAVEYFKEFVKANDVLIDQLPHIITSTIEHDSILNVLKYFEESNIITVTYLEVAKDLGHVSVESVVQSIRDETVLVTVMMANNETGAIQPLQQICQKVNELNVQRIRERLPQVLTHTDAAQTLGKVEVDVEKIGVDYLTVVGHKFYGPRIGCLWVRNGCTFFPMLHGGGQERGKRPGTENTPMIAGLGEAARLVTANLTKYNSHFKEMKNFLKERLHHEFGSKLIFNGQICETLPNTLNVSILGDGLTGREVLKACQCLQASIGAACHTDRGDKPSSILIAHGVNEDVAKNAIRLSIGRETSRSEIELVVMDLKAAVKHIQNSISG